MGHMQFTEHISVRLTKQDNDKLLDLARQLKVRRADIVRLLIAGADLQYRVAPMVTSRIVAETREEYKS